MNEIEYFVVIVALFFGFLIGGMTLQYFDRASISGVADQICHIQGFGNAHTYEFHGMNGGIKKSEFTMLICEINTPKDGCIIGCDKK
jgi:hypothetical protein